MMENYQYVLLGLGFFIAWCGARVVDNIEKISATLRRIEEQLYNNNNRNQ